MRNKKLGLMLASIALIAIIVAGGSLAYLTDRDSDVNVFTVGNVDIELTEDFVQDSKLTPGNPVTKAPTVKNIGSNDAYVWVKVAVPTTLANVIEKTTTSSAWTWKTATDEVTLKDANNVDASYTVYTALYNSKLAVGASTDAPMTEVKLDFKIDIDSDGKWIKVDNGTVAELGWTASDNGAPIIYVSAYAIQAEGITDTDDAYDLYGSQWGDKADQWGNPTTTP